MAFRSRMRRLPLRDIRLTDRFWSRWQRVLREVTIEAEFEQIVKTGRLQKLSKQAYKAVVAKAARAARAHF